MKAARLGFTCVGLLMLCGIGHAQQSDDLRLAFNIHAQSMEQALTEFGRATGLQVLFQSKVVAEQTAPSVVGSLSPETALQRLLAGSNLRYEFVNSKTVTIREKAIPVSREVTSVEKGSLQSLRLAAAVASDQGQPSTRVAMEDENTATAAASAGLEEVVVIGSRLKLNLDQSAVPVVIFDRKKIDELGVSNVADVLNYLPQQSFRDSEQSSFGATRTVTLRGLNKTALVLINGRRTVTSALLASSSSFDLNTIPLAAVERIEVLSDSASAIYGTDAIGGVVNVVLKSNLSVPNVELYYGKASGGADERRASLSFGHLGERFNASAVLDVFDRDFLKGDERELFANQDFSRFGGPDVRETRANPGNICSADGSNLPGLVDSCAAVPRGSSGVGLTPSDFAATSGIVNLESTGRFTSVVPAAKRTSAAGWADFQLTNNLTIFAEALYSNRDDTQLLTPAGLFSQTVPAENAFNPFGTDVTTTYLFTGIGPRRQVTKADSLRGVVGFEGHLGEWEWEVSGLGIRENAYSSVFNEVDLLSVEAALESADPSSALNVFQHGPGGSSALLASLISPPVRDEYSAKALQGSAFLRGALFDLPGGAVEAVVGTELRSEEIDFSSGFVIADRDTSATYAELRVPLISEVMKAPFARQLAVTIAGRYDDYSDFGNSFNPQYGIEWSPLSTLLLRAAYSTSFRAPSLVELGFPQFEFPSTFIDHRRNDEVIDITQRVGGNPELDPEEADSTTLGFVWSPLGASTLRISANYWRIEQENVIQLLGLFTIGANEELFPDRIVRAPQTPADLAAGLPGQLQQIISTYVNFGQLKTNGFDARVGGSFDANVGTISTSILATWVRKYDAATVPGVPAIDRLGIANVVGTIPRFRSTATVAWSNRGRQAGVTARYVSGYADADFLNTPTGRHVGSQTLLDLQASLNFSELLQGGPSLFSGLQVRSGIMNLFDSRPKFSEVLFAGYDPSQADLRQRFGYVALSKTF